MQLLNDKSRSNGSLNGQPSAFRRILPQVVATTIKNFHMIDWGLTGGIASIILPSLSGIPNKQNQGEFLSIDPFTSSYLVSIVYATQMLGSFISGMENSLVSQFDLYLDT